MTPIEWVNDPIEQKKFFDEIELYSQPVKLAASEIKKYTKEDEQYWMYYAILCNEKARRIASRKGA
ncbi:hypothetical protein [Serratia ureilytica]|jgi:hypothetical protein|uniref:hypothetical protein n=1 Tax=Serratia ureilytica TaxID=300181 RepID=UPI0019D2027D|nr:hypothetical protein [Serratia ureilytica]MBN5214263.1 hypothetical protein [Serratia ureilytica]